MFKVTFAHFSRGTFISELYGIFVSASSQHNVLAKVPRVLYEIRITNIGEGVERTVSFIDAWLENFGLD